jgi:hypothetical protein
MLGDYGLASQLVASAVVLSSIFAIDMQCVFTEVRTELLSIIQMNFTLRRMNYGTGYGLDSRGFDSQ